MSVPGAGCSQPGRVTSTLPWGGMSVGISPRSATTPSTVRSYQQRKSRPEGVKSVMFHSRKAPSGVRSTRSGL